MSLQTSLGLKILHANPFDGCLDSLLNPASLARIKQVTRLAQLQFKNVRSCVLTSLFEIPHVTSNTVPSIKFS